MTYTPVIICNMALNDLSARNIVSIDEDTTEGRLCLNSYGVSRQCVLEEHSWSFATKSSVLPKLNDSPITVEITAHSGGALFLKPADCIRVLRVSDEVGRRLDWKLEGQYIICRTAKIVITYIWDNEDVDNFSPSCVDAIKQKLSAELAFPLTQDTELYKILIVKYMAKLEVAINNDSMQGINQPLINNTLTRIR